MNFTDITVKDRVMLFLLDYIKEDLLDASESESEQVLKSLPVEITQEGIAERVGIRWNHSSRALKELTGMKLVEMKKANIAGGRRSRRVYFLTNAGLEEANSVLTQVNNQQFEILKDGSLDKMSFAQIHRKYAEDIQFFEFLKRFEQIFQNIVQEGAIIETVDFRRNLDRVARVHHHLSMPSNPMVGRENERQLLLDVIENGPRTIVVIGLPGMGKTTLVSNLIGHLNDYDTFYYPIHEWDSDRSLLMVIAQFLEKLKKYRLKDLLKSSTVEGAVNQEVFDPWIIHEILHEDLGSEKCLIVFDDYQKVSVDGQKVLSMIHSICSDSGNLQLMILTREIPTFYSKRDVIANNNVFEQRIEGIDYLAVSSILKEKGLVENALHPIVYQVTGGHPLAVELIASSGDVENAENLNSYIRQEVVSHLDEESKSLLRKISVHRKPIHLDLMITNESDLIRLDKLASLSLINVNNRMIILHDVIRSVVYDSLPEQLKRTLHKSAATMYFEGGVEYSIESLYHLIAGKDFEGFISQLRIQSTRIISQGYAPDFLGILNEDDTSVDAVNEMEYYSTLLELYLAVGDYQQYCAYHDMLKEIPGLNSQIENRLRILNGRMKYYEGDWATSISVLDDTSKTTNESQKTPQSEALLWKGKAYIRMGETEQARQSLEEALKVSEELDDRILRGKILMALSWVSDKDIDHAVEAANIFEEEGDLYDLAEAMNYVGRLYYKKGDHDAALEHWMDGIDIGRSTGNFRLKAVMEYNAASILTERKEFERAHELLRECTRTFRNVHFKSGYVYSMVGFGDYYLHRGDYARARRFLEKGREIASGFGDEKGIELVDRELEKLDDLEKGS